MRAFTLLETIIALFIVSFVLIFLFLIISNFSDYYIFIVSEMIKRADVDISLKEIEGELRSMVYSKKGSYPIELAKSSEIIFYKDLKSDGIPEKIHYFVMGNNLYKHVFLFNSTTLNYDSLPAINKIMIKDLSTSSVFKYFNKNFQETSNLADVRVIEVSLGSIIKSPDKIYVNSVTVVPRNLKEKE
ncbi:MAG: hypothetical protein KatS3mg095_0573 [Candidatus Parcubacteria bacterium]|nr:MAG: hypothetical protein KatS3mg095_0573 [Candidatus Parcubacteria bacterium]